MRHLFLFYMILVANVAYMEEENASDQAGHIEWALNHEEYIRMVLWLHGTR